MWVQSLSFYLPSWPGVWAEQGSVRSVAVLGGSRGLSETLMLLEGWVINPRGCG